MLGSCGGVGDVTTIAPLVRPGDRKGSGMASTAADGGITRLERRSAVRFSEEEYKWRLERLHGVLASKEVDVYVATVPEHLNYFSGFDPTGLLYYQQLIWTRALEQPILLTHRAESELARITCWIDDIRVWHHGEDPFLHTLEILSEIGVEQRATFALELDNWYLKSSTYLRLAEAFPAARFVDVTTAVQDLRVKKSSAEIEYMRKAAAFADVGMAAALETIRPGVRETDVNAAVVGALARVGSEYPAFPNPLIGSGPRSGLFHGLPSERVIEDGDPILLEITGVSARYNSNIVRTPVAGRASARVRELYKIVEDAYQRGLEAVRPGVPVGVIDRICKEARAGYEDYIPARSGFGVELAYPPTWIGSLSILEGDPHVLEPGVVFALEPSIAQYEGVTVNIGNNILVTPDGAEELHRSPKELLELA
jgi:Xaa-Pro aminopeptidase